MRRYVVAGAFVALTLGLVVVFASGFGKNIREVPFMLKGQPAPPFALKRLDTGEVVKLEDLKGKPVVINFWATWCGPCRVEHPVIDWGGKRFGDRVQFLGIVFDDTDANARRYLEQYGTSFPQLSDPGSSTAVDYGAAGVPETYFITKDGIIRDKHVGPISAEELSAQIGALLGTSTAAATAAGDAP